MGLCCMTVWSCAALRIDAIALPSAAAPVQAWLPREMITRIYTRACACGLRHVGAVTPPPRAIANHPALHHSPGGPAPLVKESISPD